MENKVVSQKRNVAIELWRFLIAFAIIGFHTGWIIAMSCDGSLGYWMQKSNWFFGSSEVLLIFTVTQRILSCMGIHMGPCKVSAAGFDSGLCIGRCHQHRLFLSGLYASAGAGHGGEQRVGVPWLPCGGLPKHRQPVL